MRAASPRLERHRIFSSRNLEEAHGFLTAKNFVADFPRDPTPLDLHINGIYLPGMYVGHFCYGRPVALKATPARTDYWFQFATDEGFEIDVGRQRLQCDARRAAVLSPTQENLIHSAAGCGRMVLSLARDALVQTLAAQLGRPISAALEFSPSMQIDTGYGRSLVRYIHAAVADFEAGDSLLTNSVALKSFEQFIITALIFAHAHSYSNELARSTPSIAPRDVRRAIDYIEANLTNPIGLVDIVAASGVSGRALCKHFRKYVRSTPMSYLRDARFRAAREALLRARPGDRIIDIAGRFGFDHVGRFSIEYRRRFGEQPSATKRRSIFSS